jgi:hypothetical protein
MPEPFRFDAGWHFDDPIVRYDSFVPESTPKNMNTNRISAVFSAADQTTAMNNIVANEALLTFLQGLTIENRKTLNKAANGRTPFIQQAHTYVLQHPDVMPGTFDLAEFTKDVNLINAMQAYLAKVTTHFEKVRDTFMLANSDGYNSAREVYRAFKNANSNGEYDAIVEALGAFFEGQGVITPPPTP